jgi:hypothetical protein
MLAVGIIAVGRTWASSAAVLAAATPASACPAGPSAAEPLPGEQDEPVDEQERPGRGGLGEDGPVQGVRIHPPGRNASFSGSALTAIGLDDAGVTPSQASGAQPSSGSTTSKLSSSAQRRSLSA